MKRRIFAPAVTAALVVLLPGPSSALTRDIANLQPAGLTFNQSVLNQLSFGTYRDPFDELQTRPHNLLFANIGRHSNLSPWQGQEGSYTRYVNALIGNNGKSNVDNDADAIQGAFNLRHSDVTAWGMSVAFLAANDGSDDSNSTSTFSDVDDLTGFDLRGAVSRQISERKVLGLGIRVNQASSETTNGSVEQGVGGFLGVESFEQSGFLLDAGVRHFRNATSSWDVQAVGGFVGFEQREFSESYDDTGMLTDRFVFTNYDVGDISFGASAGYNKLRRERIGEIEYRVGFDWSQRELDNSDLSFSESGGGVTPDVTLLEQDPVSNTRIYLSAKTVFPAGETEMFGGAELGYSMVSGATQIDASGTIVNEEIDDTHLGLGLTVGLRQPLFSDKFRFIVSGRADLLSQETSTAFDTGLDKDDSTQTITQYAIAIEGVLANVVFDLAWLSGQEAPVIPVPLGLPSGSRRVVEFDRVVVSAAVSW